VTLNRVRRAWLGDATLPRRPIVLTFDNGYRSQYAHALPVLRRLGWVADENIQLAGLPPRQGGLSERQVRALRRLDDRRSRLGAPERQPVRAPAHPRPSRHESACPAHARRGNSSGPSPAAGLPASRERRADQFPTAGSGSKTVPSADTTAAQRWPRSARRSTTVYSVRPSR
jgi:hypothetical protein